MKEKIKFLTRLKKELMAIVLLLACLPAFANEPLSISITGPDKIGTNDKVDYTASLVGANANACVWTVTGGGSGTPTGRTYKFNAPGSESTVTISCSVSVGEGDNKRTAEDSITVTVVVPQIIIKRQSYTTSSLSNTGAPVQHELSDDTSVALIHRNIARDPLESLVFTIEVSPSDIQIQQFSISSSDAGYLRVCKGLSPYSLLETFTENGANRTISELIAGLPRLAAWGEYNTINLEASLILTINNNQKKTWNYKVFGIEGDDLTSYVTPPPIISGAVENEWALVEGSDDHFYNSLSYAVKKNPSIRRKRFWVDAVAALSWGLNTSPIVNAFHPVILEAGTNNATTNHFITSMDTFGNNDGVYSLSDVDAFFMHSAWGSDRATGTTSVLDDNCKIIYYDHKAARKSSRTEGCYTGWHLFEIKNDTEHIIIYRPEQVSSGSLLMLTSTKKYK